MELSLKKRKKKPEEKKRAHNGESPITNQEARDHIVNIVQAHKIAETEPNYSPADFINSVIVLGYGRFSQYYISLKTVGYDMYDYAGWTYGFHVESDTLVSGRIKSQVIESLNEAKKEYTETIEAAKEDLNKFLDYKDADQMMEITIKDNREPDIMEALARIEANLQTLLNR